MKLYTLQLKMHFFISENDYFISKGEEEGATAN